MPAYPDIIRVRDSVYKKRLGSAGLYGLNEKVVYIRVDPKNTNNEILNELNEVELFYAKHEKSRSIKTIFDNSLPYQKINELDIKEIMLNKLIEFEHLMAKKDNLLKQDKEKLLALEQEFQGFNLINFIEKQKEIAAELEPYLKHVKHLHDRATLVSALYGAVTKKIFPNEVQIPETYLCTLDDGTSILLSKKLSEKIKWDEFLVKRFKQEFKLPSDKTIKREDLKLTTDEAKILGKIYFIALLTGDWDIINNINMSNSGSAEKNGKLIAAIVDLGNAYGISGFRGKTQRENAFFNLDIMNENIRNMYNEFKGESAYDRLSEDEKLRVKEKTIYNFMYGKFFSPKNKPEGYDQDLYAKLSEKEKIVWSEDLHSPVKGFVNCMPYSGIVYPILPRQICADLFDITEDTVIGKAMFMGFQEAHSEALNSRGQMAQLIMEATEEVISNTVDLSKSGVQTYKDILRDENSFFNNEVPSILEDRLVSLDKMIKEVMSKKSLKQIGEERFDAVLKMQRVR